MATGSAGENDHDDLFHEVVMSEERTQDAGYHEGLQAGHKTGLLEGFQLGCEKGMGIGSELGFYYGYAKTYHMMLEANQEGKQRVMKSLLMLMKMIESFPLTDVVNQSLFEDLEKIRAKFKQVTSLLGITAHYGTDQAVKGFSF